MEYHNSPETLQQIERLNHQRNVRMNRKRAEIVQLQPCCRMDRPSIERGKFFGFEGLGQSVLDKRRGSSISRKVSKPSNRNRRIWIWIWIWWGQAAMAMGRHAAVGIASQGSAYKHCSLHPSHPLSLSPQFTVTQPNQDMTSGFRVLLLFQQQ